MKTRILKVTNTDCYAYRHEFVYRAQKQVKFLMFNWWVDIDWHYDLDLAKNYIDDLLEEATVKDITVTTEVIDYP
jgi:hypothetical protein